MGHISPELSGHHMAASSFLRPREEEAVTMQWPAGSSAADGPALSPHGASLHEPWATGAPAFPQEAPAGADAGLCSGATHRQHGQQRGDGLPEARHRATAGEAASWLRLSLRC